MLIIFLGLGALLAGVTFAVGLQALEHKKRRSTRYF